MIFRHLQVVLRASGLMPGGHSTVDPVGLQQLIEAPGHLLGSEYFRYV
jgi:hypothetical protein